MLRLLFVLIVLLLEVDVEELQITKRANLVNSGFNGSRDSCFPDPR